MKCCSKKPLNISSSDEDEIPPSKIKMRELENASIKVKSYEDMAEYTDKPLFIGFFSINFTKEDVNLLDVYIEMVQENKCKLLLVCDKPEETTCFDLYYFMVC